MEYSEASSLLHAVKHVCKNLKFKLASFEDEKKILLHLKELDMSQWKVCGGMQNTDFL